MSVAHIRTVLTSLAIAAAPIVTAPPLAAQEPFPLFAGPGAQIGVTVRDAEPADQGRQQPQAGVIIDDVRRDSPAEKAGLKRGDVVVEFDGERVRSAQQFARLVRESLPGRAVNATVVRKGRRTVVSVVPTADRPPDVFIEPDRFRDLAEGFRNFNFDNFGYRGFGARGRLGVTVEELTPQLADYFGAKEGVLVSAVATGSAAERAGLKAGDVITKVGSTTVRSRADLTRALRDVGDDGDVEIGIVRDKKETTVKATLESPRGPARSSRSRRARPA
jgi:serine protease Do